MCGNAEVNVRLELLTVDLDNIVHVLRKVEHERQPRHEIVDFDVAIAGELLLRRFLRRVVRIAERSRVACSSSPRLAPRAGRGLPLLLDG